MQTDRARPLTGRRIALAESRELDRLTRMLEQEGAIALRYPLVAILDAPDPGPVDRWLTRLVNGELDDVIFLTGEGLRRLMARAQALGLREQAVGALGQVRKITRGPKPAKALRELGLREDLAAVVPTSQGVKDTLASIPLAGRRVGLQLYGEEPNLPLVSFLEGAGAQVHTVAPYIYAPASDDARVGELIETAVTGAVDALVFTSASQVDRLWEVAERKGVTDRLRGALRQVPVAAVGPVVRQALERRQIGTDVMPAQQFFMKKLTDALGAFFAPKAQGASDPDAGA